MESSGKGGVGGVDAGDAVADLWWGGAGKGGSRVVVGDFRDGGGAEVLRDGEKGGGIGRHGEGGRRAKDFDAIADFQAGAFAEVESEGVARDLGDETVDGHVEPGNFIRELVELGGELVDRVAGGLREESFEEIAAEHLH